MVPKRFESVKLIYKLGSRETTCNLEVAKMEIVNAFGTKLEDFNGKEFTLTGKVKTINMEGYWYRFKKFWRIIK